MERLERERQELSPSKLKKVKKVQISHQNPLNQVVSKAQGNEDWEIKRKQRMKKIQNLRIDKQMLKNFLAKKYKPPILAQKLSGLFDLYNSNTHSKLNFERFCDIIDAFTQSDSKVHLRFAFNCLTGNNGKFITQSNLFDILQINDEPVFMKAFYQDYRRIVKYAIDRKKGMDERKIQLEQKVNKNRGVSGQRSPDKNRSKLKKGSIQSQNRLIDYNFIENTLNKPIALRLQLDFDDFCQIQWKENDTTPAFFDDFLMTIGEIKNNQAVSISQKHRKMCSKLAKNAVYFHFKKIVVNEHYSLLMKSFRVLAGAPKNISNDEVEIEYKITQQKMIENFVRFACFNFFVNQNKIFGVDCAYLAKRFYQVLAGNVSDKQIQMRDYYEKLEYFMAAQFDIHQEELQFVFKIYSTTGWINSTDLLDFQNDLDEDCYPEIAQELQQLINAFTQIIFANRYKRIDRICDIGFLQKFFSEKQSKLLPVMFFAILDSQIIQIFKNGIRLKYLSSGAAGIEKSIIIGSQISNN